MAYRIGDYVYFIQNGREVRQAEVISRDGEFYTLVINRRFGDASGFRLRGSRLFPSEKAAEEQLRKLHPDRVEERKKPVKPEMDFNPWDYA